VSTAEVCFGYLIDFLLNFSLLHVLYSFSCLQTGGTPLVCTLVLATYSRVYHSVPTGSGEGWMECPRVKSRLTLKPQAQVEMVAVMNHSDRRQPCYDVIDFTPLGLHLLYIPIILYSIHGTGTACLLGLLVTTTLQCTQSSLDNNLIKLPRYHHFCKTNGAMPNSSKVV
jgi:hypothetical protein